MSIIFIVHETGRTKSLKAIADKLRTLTKEKIIFLVVGQAAKKIFTLLPKEDPLKTNVITLENFFAEDEIKFIEENPLSHDQLAKIKKYLDTLEISKIIIGSPSWLKALAPFQIAQALADIATPATAFVYDGDFYKEQGCAYWSTLEEHDTAEFAWRKKYTWLASLKGSKELVPALNPPLHVEVVGDPSIDNALDVTTLSAAEQAQVRDFLKIANGQELLLVSATKKIADDLSLVENLLKKNLGDNFQIRILLHPGTLNYNEHFSAYQSLFQKYPQTGNIKIILNDSMLPQIKPEYLSNDFILISSYDREKIALAADRLCCCIPGTQATQAAISGIPVYCHLTQHISYLPNDRVDTGEQGLNKFLEKDRIRQAPLTKSDLGLSEQSSADIVIGHILGEKIYNIFVSKANSNNTLFGSAQSSASSSVASAIPTPAPRL